MLDPKTLKVDDQLEIGGQVRYYCGQDTYGCHKLSEKKGGCIFDRFPGCSKFWETAELKKPELPDLRFIGFLRSTDNSGSPAYIHPRTNARLHWSIVLSDLQIAVSRLLDFNSK